MQQATTAELPALKDDICQRVQVVATAADTSAPQAAIDDDAVPNAAMSRHISFMQSAVEQTRIADNLLLKRLENWLKVSDCSI